MSVNTIVKQKSIDCLYINKTQGMVIIKGDFMGHERVLQIGEEYAFTTDEDAYLEVFDLSQPFGYGYYDRIPCRELIEQ